MQSQGKVRIGTRGSPLALIQAKTVASLLRDAHGDACTTEIIPISTAGDRSQPTNIPLREIGGKGLFSKEIEDRLLSGDIDIAVHSAKDMATTLPDGLIMPVFLPREDVRDALICLSASDLEDLPHGARIGSSSLRRRAQLLRMRPDFRMVEFRGNVGTRLRKLQDGLADATLLAASGLKRSGNAEAITALLDAERFPPAPAQGAIGIEMREADTDMARLLAPLNHLPTYAEITAERAFLRVLDGSCRTPIGALCRRDDNTLSLYGQILSPDGRELFEAEETGPISDADAIGARVGHAVIASAGADFLARLKASD